MRDRSLQDECTATSVLNRRRRQARWVGWAVVLFSGVLLLDGLLGERGLARTIRARQELRMASDGLDQLKRENAALRDEVRRLQEDPATLEAVARRELGLVRPGEILVVLKDRQ